MDNTNLTTQLRQSYIEKGHDQKFEVVVYFFCTSLNDAMRRNAQRERQVPELAMRGMRNQLVLPTPSEGMDGLYYVTLDENEKEFEIKEFSDEF